jgi:hypothetical protein
MIVILGCAVVMMWRQVPRYDDWHWNHDLLPQKITTTPNQFLDNGRKPPNIPTPFFRIVYENGPDMYRGGYNDGFALAVEEFITFGDWTPEESYVGSLPSDTWSEDHFFLVSEAGYADARRAIESMLAGQSQSTLRHQLDRDRSYYRKLLYPICVTLLLAVAICVRLLSAMKFNAKSSVTKQT